MTTNLNLWVISNRGIKEGGYWWAFVRLLRCNSSAHTCCLWEDQTLNGNEETKQKHQMGGESNLSCYLLLYLYFKECGKREQSTAEPVWSHGQHIQIEIRIQMEGLWTCAHVLHLYSHAPVTGKVTGQFPRLPRTHSIPLGYFGVALKHVLCRGTFTTH